MLEILSKVGFDWQVALANFVNFVIIFFVLRKFAFQPILKVIKDRQDKINLGLENAQKAETELLTAEQVGKEKISKAKLEANSIIGEAQKKGDNIISTSKDEANELKNSIIKDGEKIVAQKKEALKEEVKTETANLIVDGLEKILKNNLTKDQQEVYLKNILSN